VRLYRGLKQPYKPEKCVAQIYAPAQLQGMNFTNCPYAALLYAHGSRGVVVVVDVDPDDEVCVSEELWLGPKAKRLVVWGIFDDIFGPSSPPRNFARRFEGKASFVCQTRIRARF
jgi:hypothetical protein